jgi:hypothetical protein
MSLFSLRTLAARYALGAASAENLIRVADRLLTRGTYSYSLGELATVPNPHAASLMDVGPLFVAALRELGVPLPASEADARAVLANRCIWAMAEGACPASQVFLRCWRDVVTNWDGRKVGAEQADGPAVGVMWDWYYEYDLALDIADYETVNDEDGRQSRAVIERRFVTSAHQWLLAQGLGRIDSSWLTWNDACVRRIARGIADERAFDRLPILHDALIDAGCDNEAMLEHCREQEEHTDHCLVVNLLLGAV